MNVAEVVLEVDAGWWDPPTVQLAGDFEKRHAGAFEPGELALEPIQSGDVRARGLARENGVFKLLDLFAQHIDYREVPIDDGVHERVEDVRGAMPKQLRFVFDTGADVSKALS